MSYCTQTDILDMMDEAELIQATDDEGAGNVVTSRVDKAIYMADSEIDGYLGRRYTVPMDPAPAILNTYAVDMAIYHIYSRRMGAPEHREKRYKSAIKFFEMVADGKVSLGANDPDGTGGSDQPEFDGPERVFSRNSLKGW